MLKAILLMAAIVKLPLEAKGAGSTSEFYSKHLPAGVVLGMSPDALQSARSNVKPGTPFGVSQDAVGERNDMQESSEDRDNRDVVWYRFRNEKLSAVFQSKFVARVPVEHTRLAVGKILDDLRASFSFLACEQFVQSPDTVAYLLNALLWEDEVRGSRIYFAATNREIVTLLFDPRQFGKQDFFIGPESLKEIETANEKLPETPDQNARPPIMLVDLLAKAELEKTGRSLPVKEVSPAPLDMTKGQTAAQVREPWLTKPKQARWLWAAAASFLILFPLAVKFNRSRRR